MLWGGRLQGEGREVRQCEESSMGGELGLSVCVCECVCFVIFTLVFCPVVS